MHMNIKRVQKKQGNKRKPQLFLQQGNNEEFQMVLVDQPKRSSTCTKLLDAKIRRTDDQMSLPPDGFKPMATSTPKRKNSMEGVNDHNTQVGPRLTMSQFIGELPHSSKEHDKKFIVSSHRYEKSPKQIAVKLHNFISEAPNVYETIVIDDFIDNDSSQLVISSTVGRHEKCKNIENILIDSQPASLDGLVKRKKISKTVEIPSSNLDTTKDFLRAIFCGDFTSSSKQTAVFKKTIESILSATDNTGKQNKAFQGRESLSLRRSNTLKKLIAVNDSTQLIFKDLFENANEEEPSTPVDLLQMSSSYPEVKVPTVPITRLLQRTTNFQNHIMKSKINDPTLLNFSVLLYMSRQQQKTKDPVLRNHQFEKDLQTLFQINEHRKTDSNRGGVVQFDDIALIGTARRNNELENDVTEFWKKGINLSFLGDLLERL